VKPARALLAVTVVCLALSGCAAKESASEKKAESAGATAVTVTATDTACTTSAGEGGAGTTTFSVTNNGTKVTEFYVYGKDDRVLAEVENISPGLQRELTVDFPEPGSYRLSCKPGMVGDGVSTDFTVKAATSP